MPEKFCVVDLFAGPGGLAEGFSSLSTDGIHPFKVALSVEKESSAFATLRLRSFFRQFDGQPPSEYYDYIAGELPKAELIRRFPAHWKAACEETLQAELGSSAAEREIDWRIDQINREAGDRAILVGGPPCQAYSLVGRARNRGVAGYVPSEDRRHFLYREYIRILDRLNPVAFVMENVKGILSSSVRGTSIFGQVLDDLRNAGEGYTITSFAPDSKNNQFILRSEEYGIPQSRHRVILVGVRGDLSDQLNLDQRLTKRNYVPTVSDVIRGFPALRSGLSKAADSDGAWRTMIRQAYEVAALGAAEVGLSDVAARLAALAESPRELHRQVELPPAPAEDGNLSDWLHDKKLKVTPNHYARGHMAADLARYAFASVFAEIQGFSPRAVDFPASLSPQHKNWKSNKFNDRFRVQTWNKPSSTITSHIAKDGHYFIHPDPSQCRSLTVREAARLQTFPDNYYFEGNRTQQYVQVGNAVPPLLARQIAAIVHSTMAPLLESAFGARDLAGPVSDIAA
ncbi:DNA (cytosine-5)-methyltransferase 1 [Sphingomonas sp. F9_3S_D5_B_2]